MRKLLVALLTLLAGCTTDKPVTYGALGGAAAGAGVGAIVGRASSTITVPAGMGYGAAIGVPSGILLAYTTDQATKYYILSENNEAIDLNYSEILDNQDEIQQLRAAIMEQEPRGLPDEDLAEHVYVGPSIGNHWR